MKEFARFLLLVIAEAYLSNGKPADKNSLAAYYPEYKKMWLQMTYR